MRASPDFPTVSGAFLPTWMASGSRRARPHDPRDAFPEARGTSENFAGQFTQDSAIRPIFLQDGQQGRFATLEKSQSQYAPLVELGKKDRMRYGVHAAVCSSSMSSAASGAPQEPQDLADESTGARSTGGAAAAPRTQESE